MKKVISINGSPRKKGNTATLLQRALDGAASVGAEAEMVHLYDLQYKGCTSCFSCKRVDEKHWCKCAMKDELSPVLERIMKADAVILGSPIYFGDVTGEMRSFMERMEFMNYSYDTGASNFKGRINVGEIFTMNVTTDMMNQMKLNLVFDSHQFLPKALNGEWEYMTANDTLQFNDYSKYAAGVFDEKHKRKVHQEQFPIDCDKAFDMGKRLSM